MTLNYIFKKGATNYLFVVFPAVSKKPMFNYVTTFRKTPHNILFLKDTFGEPGSYFLGRDFKFNLYEIVDQLIDKVTKGKNSWLNTEIPYSIENNVFFDLVLNNIIHKIILNKLSSKK